MKVFMICLIVDENNAQTTHVFEVFKNLSELCVTYLFAPEPRNFLQIHDEKNVIYIPFISSRIFKYVLFEVFLFFHLIYYCVKLKPDVFYVRHSPFLYSHILISKIFRIPFVLEVNGIVIEELKMMQNQLGKFIKHTSMAFEKLSEKLNYNYAEKFVVVTLGIKNYIEAKYKINPDNIFVIQNGVNTDLFKPLNRRDVIKELKLEESNHHICFVGSLAKWQGVEYLIQSAPLILKEKPNTRFLIIGEGTMKNELIDLARKTGVFDHFIFTGVVHYDEVPYYINASDICVTYKKPLKSGYSSLKLYEYMACGTVVVASRLRGFEILDECEAGVLVEPEKPKELAKAIIKLLNDPKLRLKMGKNGRQYVVKNYSWKLVAKKVKKVCMKVIKN